MQTHLNECTLVDGGYECTKGADTGQNMFFDTDTFEPLIFNVSGRTMAFVLSLL